MRGKDIKDYLIKNGIKQSYIAEKVGIPENIFSMNSTTYAVLVQRTPRSGFVDGPLVGGFRGVSGMTGILPVPSVVLRHTDYYILRRFEMLWRTILFEL